MTTTAQINPYPDVSPPAGAEPDVWEDSGPMPHRDVYTIPRYVLNSTGDPLRSPVVVAEAVQWANGTIESPSVSVEVPASPGLTSTQARDLAKLLLVAADEIDGRVAR